MAYIYYALIAVFWVLWAMGKVPVTLGLLIGLTVAPLIVWAAIMAAVIGFALWVNER